MSCETERSCGGREYVLAFGPADPEAKHGYVQVAVHQCEECLALVVEDFMPEHKRWHRQIDRMKARPTP
jgi:hypothetical protein